MRKPEAELKTATQSRLLIAHHATPPKRIIKSRKICEIPDVISPELRRQALYRGSKSTKIENPRNAVDHIHRSDRLRLFARSPEPIESHRLDVDAAKTDDSRV